MAPTSASQEALTNLRVLGNYQWYIIPLLAMVFYIYGVEVKNARESGDWGSVFAGLIILGIDIINETWNALIFYFTQYSAFWTTPGNSHFIILIGWNIEIAFMFSIAGIAYSKFLPEDKNLKILGVPNRWFLSVLFAAFCVFVEVLLNFAGALIWVYPWWEATPLGIIMIFFVGYFPFFVAASIIYDIKDVKKQTKIVGIIYAIGLTSILTFIAIGMI